MLGKLSDPKVFYSSVVGVFGFMVYGLVKTVEGYNNTLASSVSTSETVPPAAAETSEESSPANEKKATKKASVSENQADTK